MTKVALKSRPVNAKSKRRKSKHRAEARVRAERRERRLRYAAAITGRSLEAEERVILARGLTLARINARLAWRGLPKITRADLDAVDRGEAVDP